jgi:hypothetical protein
VALPSYDRKLIALDHVAEPGLVEWVLAGGVTTFRMVDEQRITPEPVAGPRLARIRWAPIQPRHFVSAEFQRFFRGPILMPPGKKMVAGTFEVLAASLQKTRIPVAIPPVLGLSKLQVAPANAKHDIP